MCENLYHRSGVVLVGLSQMAVKSCTFFSLFFPIFCMFFDFLRNFHTKPGASIILKLYSKVNATTIWDDFKLFECRNVRIDRNNVKFLCPWIVIGYRKHRNLAKKSLWNFPTSCIHFHFCICDLRIRAPHCYWWRVCICVFFSPYIHVGVFDFFSYLFVSFAHNHQHRRH